MNNEKNLNCFQFLAVKSAEAFGCDYRLMMLELWGFEYDISTPPIIGNRLGLCWKSKLENRRNLLNYHNISFDIYDFNTNILKALLTKKTDNQMIAVYIDSYNCPWLPFYMNIHRSHAFFITYIGNNSYIIFDQYSNGLKIDETFLINNADKIIVFFKQYCQKKNDIMDFLSDSIKKWEDKYFSDYRQFAFDMKNILDIKKEIPDEPISSNLIMYLKNLSEDRINFIETISLIENVYGFDLSYLKCVLASISEEYNKIRLHLVKMSYLSKIHSLDKITKSVNKILELEHSVYYNIKSIIIEKDKYVRKRDEIII